MTKTAIVPALALLAMLPTIGHAAHARPFRSPLAASSQVQVFPFPQPIRYDHHNDDYTVRVRVPGGEWQDLYEYTVTVDWDKPQKDASMVYFNFAGPVEVAVQKNNGNFRDVAIRPTSKGIKSLTKDGIVYFTLTKPEDLSVEFDGDHLHNLHIFTQGIRPDLPVTPVRATSYDIAAGVNPDLSKAVVYFGPGIFTPTDADGVFHIQSNSTVYVDGSAIIRGGFKLDGVENVTIKSDGLFDSNTLLEIRNSKNVTIDGPIFFNQLHGTLRCTSSENVQLTHIRTIGGGQWSDGLGNFSCRHVRIANSFVRTSDDSITIYNHRWDSYGDSSDIVVEDSTLWADVAHAAFMGIHGNTPSPAHPDPEIIENVRFSNIDILDVDEDEPEYEGAIGITAGDDNLIRNIVFENIRVDRIEEGKLFNFHVGFNAKYNTSPGRGIDGVTLRDISFTGKGSPGASVIFGYDASRAVTNIHLENVTINGKKITAPAPGVLQIGDHVSGVTYQ